MLKVRVDVITDLANHYIRLVGWVETPQVPAVGEVLNVFGTPYIVHRRGWAYDDEEEQMYAYLEVLPVPVPTKESGE